MARVILMVVTLSLCTFLHLTDCIRISEVFPHGVDAGDTVLAKGDSVTAQVALQTAFPVFGTERNELTISTDGWAALRATGENTSVTFQTYSADADTWGAGCVSYRETTDAFVTSVTSQVTNSVFPDLAPVNITSAVLIFWDRVGYYSNKTDKTNSFELALATDTQRTFAVYAYVKDQIQWTTGDRDGGTAGLGGDPADVGIIRDDGSVYSIPGSNTTNVLRVHEASNTGWRGVWYFRVDGNDVITPNAQQCVIGCDENAVCVDRTIGYSCVCNENYIGDDATVAFPCTAAGAPGLKYTVTLEILLLAALFVWFAN